MCFRCLYSSFKYILPVGTVVAAWYFYKMAQKSHTRFSFGSVDVGSNDLKKTLLDLTKKAEMHVNKMEPIVSYVHRKLEKYRKERKLDTVDIVGSLGNNLYFPEKLPDGSYQLELDILYVREMQNIALPVMVEANEKIPVAHLVQEMRVISHGDRHAVYKCLLEVVALEGEIKDFDRNNLFETTKGGKVYLKSSVYKSSIPRGYERTILREREIETFGPPLLLPLYRTYKTDVLSLKSGDDVYIFSILMDKVAAIRAPWPTEALEFQTRERKWPDISVINDVIEDGCLLIHQPSNGETYNLEWKITFSVAEQRLALQFSFHQRFLFILLKLIKRKYLDFGTFESGESKSGLTTYHMKTIFMWMSESLDRKAWLESPDSSFTMFFQRLKECLETETCPHFVLPGVNIMSEIWEYKRLMAGERQELKEKPSIKLTLIQTIDKILDKPEDFLSEELFHVVDEKHVFERQKEVPSTDPTNDFFDNALHQLDDENASPREMLDFIPALAKKDSEQDKGSE